MARGRSADDARWDALIGTLREIQRGLQIVQMQGSPTLPPVDPENPLSGHWRLLALCHAVVAFARSTGAEFMSVQWADGVTLTWEDGVLRIVHAEIGATTLEELQAALDKGAN